MSEESSEGKGDEPPVSRSVSDDDDADESSGLVSVASVVVLSRAGAQMTPHSVAAGSVVAGSGVVPLVAEIRVGSGVVAAVLVAVVVMTVAGPQMTPHSAAVGATVVGATEVVGVSAVGASTADVVAGVVGGVGGGTVDVTRAGPQMRPQVVVLVIAAVEVGVAGATVLSVVTGVADVTSSGPLPKLLELVVTQVSLPSSKQTSAAPAAVTPTTAVIVPAAANATRSARVRRAVTQWFRPTCIAAM